MLNQKFREAQGEEQNQYISINGKHWRLEPKMYEFINGKTTYQFGISTTGSLSR